jgi:U3 small nucleolar RNA-associated protein 13
LFRRQWLVTSSKDKTCRIWSTAYGECVGIGEGHTDAIGSICISHNPATYSSRKVFMISGASDKILKRWSLPVHSFPSSIPSSSSSSSSSSLVRHILPIQKLVCSHSIRAHDKDINCITVSPNDSIIASASQDKSIRLWSSDELTPLATLHGHKRGVWKVLFSFYDKILFSCSGDRTVKLWSIVDYTILRTFEGNTASVLNCKLINFGQQFITTSADGLLRLYNVRNSECENVFDVHEDRVWALEYFTSSSSASASASGEEQGQQEGERKEKVKAKEQDHYVLSGGSDSKLILWKDMTKEEEEQEIAKNEELLLFEQQLYNDIRNKNYSKALSLALSLKHSQKVLQILQAILDDTGNHYDNEAENEEEEESRIQNQIHLPKKYQQLFNNTFSKKLDSYLPLLTVTQLTQLILFLKDWNNNSRYCYLSQIVINTLIRLFPMKQLLEIKEFKDTLIGLQVYTERHYQRINRLLQSSYYINYLISSINGFLPLETINRITSTGSSGVGTAAVSSALMVTKKRKIPEPTDDEDEVTYTITSASSSSIPLEKEQLDDYTAPPEVHNHRMEILDTEEETRDDDNTASDDDESKKIIVNKKKQTKTNKKNPVTGDNSGSSKKKRVSV